MALRRRLTYALLMLLIVAAISIIGYLLLGGDVNFLQALYMAVIYAGRVATARSSTPAIIPPCAFSTCS